MDNKGFCYWLQGYFEIEQNAYLNKEKLALIEDQLNALVVNKGKFTRWLSQVCDYIKGLDYPEETINVFTPIIKESLSNVFRHVIDNSYVGIDRKTRHQVHEEGLNDES
ncbi:hypothetical protein ACGP04_03015 [Piscirickettsia salmonis]|uniref:hypothetical protein n=1 Tax=Piscirickettsia salmonis TaxID=1238 RepID=UPI000F07ABBB|nr:hypothetical protein DA717_12220 [Piscirickettsiaceae bacterium NZ-RLO2]